METKVCRRCGEEKPLSEFYRAARYKGGYNSRCKACAKRASVESRAKKTEEYKTYQRDWRRENRDRQNANYRRRYHETGYNLRRKYGMTKQEWQDRFDRQEGRCAICRRILNTETSAGDLRVNVDHCHATDKVRALLCHGCNVGLGSFGDDPARLAAAALYLLEHRST